MKKEFIYYIAIIAALLISCEGVKEPLTQQKLDAYLASFKALKTEVPEMLNQANKNNINSTDKNFSNFENILKQHGLTSKDYAIINAKVGAIFSTLNSSEFITEMQKMKEEGIVKMDDGMKEMQEQLNNPDVPEESKTQIRKAMDEMKAAKQEINSEFEKNKAFADKVLNKTKSLTNQIISDADVTLVKENLDKIKEAFTDGMVPTNFNVE